MTEILHGHRIVTESYFDGRLVNTKEDFDIPIFTTRETMLKDIIDAIAVISNRSTRELTINLKLDDKDRIKLTKKWRAS